MQITGDKYLAKLETNEANILSAILTSRSRRYNVMKIVIATLLGDSQCSFNFKIVMNSKLYISSSETKLNAEKTERGRWGNREERDKMKSSSTDYSNNRPTDINPVGCDERPCHRRRVDKRANRLDRRFRFQTSSAPQHLLMGRRNWALTRRPCLHHRPITPGKEDLGLRHPENSTRHTCDERSWIMTNGENTSRVLRFVKMKGRV